MEWVKEGSLCFHDLTKSMKKEAVIRVDDERKMLFIASMFFSIFLRKREL